MKSYNLTYKFKKSSWFKCSINSHHSQSKFSQYYHIFDQIHLKVVSLINPSEFAMVSLCYEIYELLQLTSYYILISSEIWYLSGSYLHRVA